MSENTATRNQLQLHYNPVFDVSINVQGGSKYIDDDGRPKRTGTVWTASLHIITAIIGSGVLSLAWAIAQLGWIAGPAAMAIFSFITYYTSTLLASCYRDPVTGKRNYSYYSDAVRSNLGEFLVKMCGFVQQLNLFGITIGYTVAASISMMTGISLGIVTPAQKMWRAFQALGNIAFAYSYSIILIEIQDTVKSPPSETKTMKKATRLSLTVTSIFYILCGCMGYAAFGDLAPGNLLTDKGFSNPFWLIDIANAAIVIHLVGAYQVFAQPIFALVEKTTTKNFPNSQFVTKDIKIQIPGFSYYTLNLFRLVWRTIFVILTTVISMIFPFFNDIVGFLGALGFWPLTVYFPVEMYIAQKKIPMWSTRWMCLQTLSLCVLIIALSAAAGSVTGVIHNLKVYRPFKTSN
ncbi:hypothetical protein C1H46_014726 [Malus baccata]|uniref:Amino acid transporter transmembrane domain-containing protein n=1 Tax=Malus baccata TaxID=106549 RepID=A0A540MLL4_MALBA|nr:hypothetical protein C1H46_014726 [Malus baccata]